MKFGTKNRFWSRQCLCSKSNTYGREIASRLDYEGKDPNVVIPHGVTYIGPSVFANGSNLQSVKRPEGLTHIGEQAFAQAPKLELIHIPDSVTEFERNIFIDSPNVVLHVSPGSAAEQYAKRVKFKIEYKK